MLLVRKQEELEGRPVCVFPQRSAGGRNHAFTVAQRSHTQHCWLGHVTGITGSTTGATGTISAS